MTRRQSSRGDRANRGIGQALVEEALKRGAKRVYAGTRQPWPTRMGMSRPRPWT
jgi:ribosomal protein S18 acetylase RimI-like enzyme